MVMDRLRAQSGSRVAKPLSGCKHKETSNNSAYVPKLSSSLDSITASLRRDSCAKCHNENCTVPSYDTVPATEDASIKEATTNELSNPSRPTWSNKTTFDKGLILRRSFPTRFRYRVGNDYTSDTGIAKATLVRIANNECSKCQADCGIPATRTVACNVAHKREVACARDMKRDGKGGEVEVVKMSGKRSAFGAKISQSFYDLTSSQRLRSWRSKLHPGLVPSVSTGASSMRIINDSHDEPRDHSLDGGGTEVLPSSYDPMVMSKQENNQVWDSPLHASTQYPSMVSNEASHHSEIPRQRSKEDQPKKYRSPSVEALEESHYDVAILRSSKADGNGPAGRHVSRMDRCQARASWFQGWPSPSLRPGPSKLDHKNLDKSSSVDISVHHRIGLNVKGGRTQSITNDCDHSRVSNTSRLRPDKPPRQSPTAADVSGSSGEVLHASLCSNSTYVELNQIAQECLRQQRDRQIHRHSMNPLGGAGAPCKLWIPRDQTEAYGRDMALQQADAADKNPYPAATREALVLAQTNPSQPAKFVVESGVPLVQSKEIIRPVAFRPVVPTNSVSSFSGSGSHQSPVSGQRTPADLTSLELALQDLTESTNCVPNLELVKRPYLKDRDSKLFNATGSDLVNMNGNSSNQNHYYRSDNDVNIPCRNAVDGISYPGACRSVVSKHCIASSEPRIGRTLPVTDAVGLANRTTPGKECIPQVRYIGRPATSGSTTGRSPANSGSPASDRYKCLNQPLSNVQITPNPCSSNSDYDIPVPSTAISNPEVPLSLSQHRQCDNYPSTCRHSTSSSANGFTDSNRQDFDHTDISPDPVKPSPTKRTHPGPEIVHRGPKSHQKKSPGMSQPPHFPSVLEPEIDPGSISNPIYSVAPSEPPSVSTSASTPIQHTSPNRQSSEPVSTMSTISPSGGVSHLPLRGNFSPQGSQNSSCGLHVTPSSSDSGVLDLESILRDKEQELTTLRSTMEQNEQVILRVCQEKEERWQDKLQEWSNRLEQSIRTEHRLLSQVQSLQEERQGLLGRVEELSAEKVGLQRKCRELEAEFFDLKDQLQQQSSQPAICSMCMNNQKYSQSNMHNGQPNSSPCHLQHSSLSFSEQSSRFEDSLTSDAGRLRAEVSTLRGEVDQLKDALKEQVDAFRIEKSKRIKGQRYSTDSVAHSSCHQTSSQLGQQLKEQLRDPNVTPNKTN